MLYCSPAAKQKSAPSRHVHANYADQDGSGRGGISEPNRVSASPKFLYLSLGSSTENVELAVESARGREGNEQHRSTETKPVINNILTSTFGFVTRIPGYETILGTRTCIADARNPHQKALVKSATRNNERIHAREPSLATTMKSVLATLSKTLLTVERNHNIINVRRSRRFGKTNAI